MLTIARSVEGIYSYITLGLLFEAESAFEAEETLVDFFWGFRDAKEFYIYSLGGLLEVLEEGILEEDETGGRMGFYGWTGAVETVREGLIDSGMLDCTDETG